MKKSLVTQTKYIKKIRNQNGLMSKTICGIDLACFPGVYAGGTDSELMIDQMQINQGDSVLDLCTGNGIIAFGAIKKGAGKVVGMDLNPEAIKNANFNKKKLSFRNIKFLISDLFSTVQDKFDVITIKAKSAQAKALNLTEICFWDENNSVLTRFFKEFNLYLKDGGRAYFAWADFADQKLLKDLSKKYDRNIKLLASKIGRTGFRFDIYSIN
ncbi:MAG: methyltransferase domain-containing protein [Patescibacteria group bacterium]|nr:methyltransferase domain-containing protein [Patescibacteria group bacterium]